MATLDKVYKRSNQLHTALEDAVRAVSAQQRDEVKNLLEMAAQLKKTVHKLLNYNSKPINTVVVYPPPPKQGTLDIVTQTEEPPAEVLPTKSALRAFVDKVAGTISSHMRAVTQSTTGVVFGYNTSVWYHQEYYLTQEKIGKNPPKVLLRYDIRAENNLVTVVTSRVGTCSVRVAYGPATWDRLVSKIKEETADVLTGTGTIVEGSHFSNFSRARASVDSYKPWRKSQNSLLTNVIKDE